MNRKKKINETLKKKAKKANAKNQRSNKPRYISKAERAVLAEQQSSTTGQSDNAQVEPAICEQ